MPLLLLLAACQTPCLDGFAKAADGACYPIATNGEGEEEQDILPTPQWAYGDGITTFYQESITQGFYEVMDASDFDETQVIMIGQGGALLVDRESGAVSDAWGGVRLLKVDAQDGIAVGAGSEQPMTLPAFRPFQAWNLDRAEDIAIFDDVVAVAARTQGVQLFNAAGTNRLGNIATDDAWAVELQGTRALVVDDRELELWELSDPANPVLLDSLSLAGEGRDISWVGDRVAVAVGGWGGQVLNIQNDTLVKAGLATLPGSVLNLSLEPNGEWLWLASWETVGLAWVGGEEPVVVAHEPPAQSAMAVIAGEGRGYICDWMTLTGMERTGLTSGELHMGQVHDQNILMVDPRAESLDLEVANWGPEPLQVSLELPSTLSGDIGPITLPPNSRETFTLTGPIVDAPGLRVLTDDADEELVEIAIRASATGVGSTHPEISLQGFEWPDGGLQPYNSGDHAGDVIFLAYWSSW
ncbi:MAG: hypothetical protein ACI9VR_002233 [Cognaticolwellia sp.]|jgi:hypothetical protein